MLRGAWKEEAKGCLIRHIGDVRMLVEEVGRGVRIVVWRSNGVIWSEQVLASASAANARTGMIIAERMALLHGEVTTAAIWPPWGSFFLSNPNGGRLDL